jgi:DedD protein
MAKQIVTDEEFKLKRQARRRLIGAIALTVLVVVLLPMVLDREPPLPTQDIELQIPDKNKSGEFVPQMALPSLDATDASSQPVSAPVIAPLLDSKPAPTIVAPLVEQKPVVVPESKVEVVQMPVKSVDKPKHPAEHKTTAKPSIKPIAKGHAGFVLQVGAFANADAAKQLRDKLHKQGYRSYTEKSGNKIRVRIGDFSTQSEAEKVQRKLEIQGMKPDVINLN